MSGRYFDLECSSYDGCWGYGAPCWTCQGDINDCPEGEQHKMSARANNLVKRLRDLHASDGSGYVWETAQQAADEIERMQKALGDQTSQNKKLVNKVHNISRKRQRLQERFDRLRKQYVESFKTIRAGSEGDGTPTD